MFDLSTPAGSLTVITGVIMSLAQLAKEYWELEGRYAQMVASLIGAILGIAWYAAWYTELVDPDNLALVVLGAALAVLGFALVPSGLYKFTMSAMDVASKGRG